jgi:hypothetical protein
MPSCIASEAPRSSHTIDMRSIVMAMMTIGNNAIESAGCKPSRWLSTLMPAISNTTTVSTHVRRGTSSKRSFSR